MKKTKIPDELLSPHYKRLMSVINQLGLTLADANKITNRAVASYMKIGDPCYGQVPLGRLKDTLGINPVYIRTGEGEPLLPNYKELLDIYKGIKRVEPLKITDIKDLPTELQKKAVELFKPESLIKLPNLQLFSRQQILYLYKNIDYIENEALASVKSIFNTIRSLGEFYDNQKNENYFNTEIS